MNSKASLSHYAEHVGMLMQKFEGISASRHLAPVMDLFPASPAKIADIGAGSGRDAAWLAAEGYEVVAAEPVAELLAAAKAEHQGANIEWVEDGLPELTALRRYAPFDLILLSGVWHHIAPEDRSMTIAAFAEILMPGGLVVIALRQGPTDPERGLYDSFADETSELAQHAGFEQLALRDGETSQWGNQASGVLGSWLVLRKG